MPPFWNFFKNRNAYDNTRDSEDSSEGIDTGWGMDGWGLIPGRGKNISLLHSQLTGSGVHLASFSMGIEGSFPGVKRPIAKVRNGGAVPPLPHTASWRSAYLIEPRDSLSEPTVSQHFRWCMRTRKCGKNFLKFLLCTDIRIFSSSNTWHSAG
jgi:hypothetical protein